MASHMPSIHASPRCVAHPARGTPYVVSCGSFDRADGLAGGAVEEVASNAPPVPPSMPIIAYLFVFVFVLLHPSSSFLLLLDTVVVVIPISKREVC